MLLKPYRPQLMIWTCFYWRHSSDNQVINSSDCIHPAFINSISSITPCLTISKCIFKLILRVKTGVSGLSCSFLLWGCSLFISCFVPRLACNLSLNASALSYVFWSCLCASHMYGNPSTFPSRPPHDTSVTDRQYRWTCWEVLQVCEVLSRNKRGDNVMKYNW